MSKIVTNNSGRYLDKQYTYDTFVCERKTALLHCILLIFSTILWKNVYCCNIYNSQKMIHNSYLQYTEKWKWLILNFFQAWTRATKTFILTIFVRVPVEYNVLKPFFREDTQICSLISCVSLASLSYIDWFFTDHLRSLCSYACFLSFLRFDMIIARGKEQCRL
jgi:hypothetical protein